MLALSFLLLIGLSLLLEGFEQHIRKGYNLFAMGFSVFVEMINLRARAKARARPPARAIRGKPRLPRGPRSNGRCCRFSGSRRGPSGRITRLPCITSWHTWCKAPGADTREAVPFRLRPACGCAARTRGGAGRRAVFLCLPSRGRPVAGNESGYIPQRVFDSQRKRFTDFEMMSADLARADVVLVGEQHDDGNTHRLERAILEALPGAMCR
jgi:hypothetical protein